MMIIPNTRNACPLFLFVLKRNDHCGCTRYRPCERGREDEDEDDDGLRVNALFFFFSFFLFLIRRVNDLITNF